MNECEKTISKLNSEHNIKFVILLFIYYYLKIIRRDSRSPQNAEFGRFRLLGTLSIDNEMARRRRAEVKFSMLSKRRLAFVDD